MILASRLQLCMSISTTGTSFLHSSLHNQKTFPNFKLKSVECQHKSPLLFTGKMKIHYLRKYKTIKLQFPIMGLILPSSQAEGHKNPLSKKTTHNEKKRETEGQWKSSTWLQRKRKWKRNWKIKINNHWFLSFLLIFPSNQTDECTPSISQRLHHSNKTSTFQNRPSKVSTENPCRLPKKLREL